MSELFTAEKAKELYQKSSEKIEKQKQLEYENRIKKLIDDTPEIRHILKYIKISSQEWRSTFIYNTNVMIAIDWQDMTCDLITEKIVEVLNYLWYKTRVSNDANHYKRILISW